MATPKLRFKEFDGDWANFNLGDISDIKTGPFGSTLHQKDYVEIGTPIITVEHLGEVGLTSQNLPLVSDEDKVRLKSYMLDEGDLAFSRVGSVDRCAIITDKEKGWLFSGRILRVRPNKKLVHSKNLMYALKTEDAKYRIRSVAVGQTMPSLNTEILKNFSINLSNSVEEQTKIASFLSVVDEKISQLTQKHELLSQYKQGMMQKLFSQQIRFKADDGSEFGEWEEISANELFENYSNKDHDGTLTILAATQDKGIVPRDEIDIDIKSSDASVLSYKIIEKGSFVISLRSFQGGIEYSNYYGICSPAYTILRSLRPIASEFYKNYLKTNDFIQRLSATVVGIRDGKQISYQAFSTLNIDYPSVEEQTKIANFLSAIDQKIEVVAQQIEQAKQWKKGLLQQMFV